MRNPRSRAAMIGLLLVIVLLVGSWPVPSMARCNDVSESGVVDKIFGQFSTYFRSSAHRETETTTRNFPSAWKDRRFDDSDIFVKVCDHPGDGDTEGAGQAALILEKSGHGQGVFLHDSVFRLWHKRADVTERWLEDGKEILSKSAIRGCVFDSAAIESTRNALLGLLGNGLRQWQALCWNGLFSGYAALIRQDLIDGSHDGEIERRFGDHQLLVWIDIKALVD